MPDYSPEELAALQARAYGSGGGDPGAPTSIPAAPIVTAPPPGIPNAGGTSSAGGDPSQPSSAVPPVVAPQAPVQVVTGQQRLANSLGYSGDPSQAPQPIDPALLAQPTPQVTTTSGSTVQKGIPLSAETKALVGQGDKMVVQGQAGEAGALGASQTAHHAATQQIAGMQQQAAAQAMGEQARTEATLTSQRAAIKAATDDITSRKRKTYWQSKNTGSRVAIAIASALGAFSAGYKQGGGHDSAADILKASQEDYEHVEDAKDENAQKSLNAKMAAYGLDSSAFHDADQKRAAIRTVQITAAAQQIQDRADETNDPLERYKLQQLQGQVLAARGVEHAKLDEMTANKVTTHSSSTTTSGGAPAGGLPSDRIVQGPDEIDPKTGKSIPGKMFLAPSPEAAKKLREDSAVAKRLQDNLAKVKELRGMGQVPGTDAHAKMGALLADVRRDWLALNSEHLKASGGGMGLVDQAVGDPDSMFDWHGGARLDALASGVKADLASNYQTAGVVPLGPSHIAIVNGKPVLIDPSIPTYGGKGK